jgi:hypothetical protein
MKIAITPAERLSAWLKSVPNGEKGKALEMVELFAAPAAPEPAGGGPREAK